MPRKGENIYKRKDGRWEGRYIKGRSPSGKALYGYVYAPSYKAVKSKLLMSASTVRLSGQDFQKEKTLLFRDLASIWFQHISPGVKESTWIKYQNIWNVYIAPKMQNLYVSEITQNMLETFCQDLMGSGGKNGAGLSAKTTSDILSVIKNMLRFSEKLGCAPGNSYSVMIRQAPKPLRILTSQEQQHLCHYLYTHREIKNLGILLCLYTGIRVGEICALQWKDISLSDETIYIHQTMQRLQTNQERPRTKVTVTSPKSKSSIRVIPLPKDLLSLLMECGLPQTGYFLTGSETKYVEPRSMQNQFKRVIQACGIPDANFHSLRHTFATRCVELSFDAKTLSELLGHASVNITMNRYVHPTMEMKRASMQRLTIPFPVK